MCGVQLKDRKRSTDLMFMLSLSDAVDHFAMANRVRWYGHVLSTEDGHVMRRVLDFEVEGQGKKGRLNGTWKKQVEGESVKIGLRKEDACRSMLNVGINQIVAGLR